MPMAMPALTPILATVGIGFLYYRRIRSQFGRQAYKPRRALVRLCLLGVIALFLLFAAVFLPHVALAVVAGGLIGVVLGVVAMRHTHVEPGVPTAYYTPNPWIGGALSLVLVGRIAWRWGSGAFSPGMTANDASPWTLAIAAALVAYFLAYGIGLRRRALPGAPQ